MPDIAEQTPPQIDSPEEIGARRMMDDIADEAILLAERKHIAITDAISIVAAVFGLLLTMPPAYPPLTAIESQEA
jgi:hypothetical protein